MKRSKKYIEAAAKVIKDHLYTPLEAVTLAKETSTVKLSATKTPTALECASFCNRIGIAITE